MPTLRQTLHSFIMLRFVVLCTLVTISLGAAPRWRTMRPTLDGRIVGGEDANIEDLPYQLSLQSFGSHICGASIVSKTRAITAAHCTSGSSARYLTLRAGSSYRGSGGTVHQVETIYQHPKYDSWTTDFDVSVLVVKGFAFGPGVAAIGIHPQGAELAVGTLATVSGWGALSSGGSSPIQLQKVQVPKVSDSSCSRSYGDITARMTCHGFDQGGKDSCQGDSGGPLVYNGQLVGIVSWGAGCAAAGYPGVYGKVSDKDMHDHIVAHL